MIEDPVSFFRLIVGSILPNTGVDLFGVARLLRLDVAVLATASQGAIGGPSNALAIAVARGWKQLILPGIIVGLLGYALGNYLGLGVAYLLRGIGVGL